MQLLRNVEANRQAWQLGWSGDAEIVGQCDGIDPFDVHLTGLRAGDSAEREALIWLSGQRLLEAVGEVRSRVPEDDVDVLCGAGAIAQPEFERDTALTMKSGESAFVARSRTPAMIM